MLNPWMIIGVMVAVGGAYGYGHHAGWADRDAEMQAEIAKLNEKSRETEQALTQTLNDKDTALRKAKNEISKKQSDAYKLVDAGKLRFPVQAPQVAYNPPQMPPLPPEIGMKKDPTLTERLLKLLSPSQSKETETPSNSTPASTVTTK